MPEFLVWVGSLAYGAAATAAQGAFVLFQAALVVYGVVDAQKQQRKAKRAYESSLTDRTLVLRSQEAPRTIVYGKARGSGPLIFACTHGTKKEFLTVVVALAGHEIQAIDEVWLDDADIGTLDGSGYVQSGSKYYKSRTVPVSHYVASVPAAAGTITLSYTPTTFDSFSVIGATDQMATELLLGTDYSRSGATITMISSTYAGLSGTATYRRDDVKKLVRAKKFLGLAAGERDTDLETNSGGDWTSAHLGKSVARVHVTIEYDPDVFPSGLPNISCLMRGKKVYDPRTTTTVYSDNVALLTRDYLTDALGFGCASGEINDTAVTTAANICDESVATDGSGGTQLRYIGGGILGTDADRKGNLQQLLSAMLGTAVFTQGTWTIRAAAYVTPTITLTDSDLADGPVTIGNAMKRASLFNAVRGKFIDPAAYWKPNDFPPYDSSTYATADGGDVIYRDIELPFTNDPNRAQRIAKLNLFRERQDDLITATFKLTAYRLTAGDTLTLTLSRYTPSGQVMRVLDRRYDPQKCTVTLIMQAEASAVYAWNYSEATAITTPASPDLPDPSVVPDVASLAANTSATIFKRLSDGTLIPQLKLTWTASSDIGVVQGGKVEVWYKRKSDLVYSKVDLPGDAAEYYIEPVAAGQQYNITVRFVNGAQSKGNWAFVNHTVSSSTPTQSIASANLLRNTTFIDTQGWTVFPNGYSDAITFEREATYGPLGEPHAARFRQNGTQSLGSGLTEQSCYSEPVPVIAGQRYVAFSGLYANRSNGAYIMVRWYDVTDTATGSDSTSASTPDRGSGAPANKDEFDIASMFCTAPAGATHARFFFRKRPTNTGSDSQVFVLEPFFGVAATTQIDLPTYDPGGSNVVDTRGIKKGGATLVGTVQGAGPTNIADNLSITTVATVTEDFEVGDEAVVSISLKYKLYNATAGTPGERVIESNFEAYPPSVTGDSSYPRVAAEIPKGGSSAYAIGAITDTWRYTILESGVHDFYYKMHTAGTGTSISGTSSVSEIEMTVQRIRR